MKTLAYLDCPTGIAGDMCLGALIHAGVPLDYLTEHLGRLGIAEEFELRVEPVLRQGQSALRATVVLASPAAIAPSPLVPASPDPDHRSLRRLGEIVHLIRQAHLPERVTDWSLAIFQRLARAEGAVHGIPPEQVHFHEVGATDALVDIVGTCLGLDWLQVDALFCSALPTGAGLVRAAHGWLPVPAPAVLQLLQMGQVPIYSNGLQKELVTPTGAAIATTLAHQFGPPPTMTLHKVGLGAGGHDLPIPNVLRLWIGEAPPFPAHAPLATATIATPPHADHPHSHSHPHPHSHSGSHSHAPHSHTPQVHSPHVHSPQAHPPHTHQPTAPDPPQGGRSPVIDPSPPAPSPSPILESVAVLETQVDDLSPQAIGYLYDRLWEVGALDVFTQAVGMKKSRPGVLITVICPPDCIDPCEQVIFAETTTLGIRRQLQERHALKRTLETIETPYGPVQLKLAYHPETGHLMNVHPEFEDCAHLARHHQIPWQEVHRLALSHWYVNRGALQSGKGGE